MQTHGKGVLFDLDGTLVNTIRDIREAINTALIAEHLSPIDDAQTKMVVGQGLAKALRGALALSGRMVSESRLEELYRILIEYYEGHACVYSRPYPGSWIFFVFFPQRDFLGYPLQQSKRAR